MIESEFDIILRNGIIYDGTSNESITGNVGIKDGKIIQIGDFGGTANEEIDVNGLAVSPGFINMLSWSVESLIEDGRALGTIMQGVTLEVLGEGWSYGPLNEKMKNEIKDLFNSPIEYEVEWNTLGEYLEYLESKGISTNVASFVGATTVRINVLGHENREPNTEELEKMKYLVDESMREGAMGLGSSLIYPPAFYADTEELIELAKVASKYGGMYISHIRSEGSNFLEAVDELIEISRKAEIPAEIYHLKAAGKSNWNKLEDAIKKIEEAQNSGLAITTDMYLYPAAGTGLSSTLPPWVSEGGQDEFLGRLKDPSTREQIKSEMLVSNKEWENLFVEAGPENILVVAVANDDLRHLIGKRISEIAQDRNQDPRDTIIDLLIEDRSRIGCIYFLMTEENVRRKITLPYMSFGSDGASMSAEGIFLRNAAHPRAYGNFARLLGRYVREEKLISLAEAIRKLTSLPAKNLKLEERGQLKEGYYADIAVFDPNTIVDTSTFENGHQLAKGIRHVIVNGELVVRNGVHTGATPGKFIRGPGYQS